MEQMNSNALKDTYNTELRMQQHLQDPVTLYIGSLRGKNCSLLSLVIHKVSELRRGMLRGSVANRKFTEIYPAKRQISTSPAPASSIFSLGR